MKKYLFKNIITYEINSNTFQTGKNIYKAYPYSHLTIITA
jgi:hypothetical protein